MHFKMTKRTSKRLSQLIQKYSAFQKFYEKVSKLNRYSHEVQLHWMFIKYDFPSFIGTL